MRIFYNEDINSIVISGSRSIYPPRSMTFAYVGSKVEIWLKGENMRILGPVDFSRIHNEAGVGHNTLQETLDYLEDVNQMAPEDPADVVNLNLLFNNNII